MLSAGYILCSLLTSLHQRLKVKPLQPATAERALLQSEIALLSGRPSAELHALLAARGWAVPAHKCGWAHQAQNSTGSRFILPLTHICLPFEEGPGCD